jgi:hypothetical protein
MARNWRKLFMPILLLSLLLLTCCLPVPPQSVSISDTPKSGSDYQTEALKVTIRAESFLSACIQRDWIRAAAYLSSTSPIVLSDDQTAADDWLVQRHGTQEPAATGTAKAPRIPVERAPAPLYDDPIWHGATDPAVVWMPGKGTQGEYWMYYTQRRATLENANGVDWVHGSTIGIATSVNGINWSYKGTIQGSIPDGDTRKSLSDPVKDGITWWAPTVFWEGGNGIAGGGQPGDRLHMFVTYVHGIFTSWTGHRTIEHFTSTDGVNWTYVSSLHLASRRAIDPSVYKIDGTWYLWYKNEAAGSSTYWASSKDLTTWQDLGDSNCGRSHEATFVWHWQGAYWNLHDNHGRGLDAWRSETGLSDWTLNSVLLNGDITGQRRLDQGVGHHPWVLLQDPASGPAQQGQEQLVLFYFTHNGKKTVMQMAEVTLDADGKLRCDRNQYAAQRIGRISACF